VHASIRVFVTTVFALGVSFLIWPVQPARGQCMFTNGDFETGNLTGWTQYNRSNEIGNWYNYTGTMTPLSIHTISAPPQGTRAATTDQTAATTHELYQDFTVPLGQSGTLSFYLAYNNLHTSFISLNTLDFVGNQQARIDLIRPSTPNESIAASNVWVKLFQTKPGDPNFLAPTLMTFDVSGFAGVTTRLRFAEAVGINFFPLAVDNVCLSTTRGTITRPTPVGSNIRPDFGGVNLKFPTVVSAGTTSLTQLDPAVAQTGAPVGITFIGPAYDLSTTATVTTPIHICMYLPSIADNNTFNNLRMLHKVAGIWTELLTSSKNMTAKILCADAPSLSQFTVGVRPGFQTAAPGQIRGRITDAQDVPVAGAVVRLAGSQNRKVITDDNGNYTFAGVTTGGFYTVSPSRANYSFTPGERSFSQLANGTDAEFTAIPDGGNSNLLDTSEYFVRQHYLDFLGREPDEAGFNFWGQQIASCTDSGCVERRKINVSAAYFLSIEFQKTGGLIDALYQMSLGRAPTYDEFIPDTQTIARDIVVGRTGWESQLTANKQSFVAEFVQRDLLRGPFEGSSSDCYVDTLLVQRGISFAPGERADLITGLETGRLTREVVLLRLAEDERYVSKLRNAAFVRMQYFGYLRRDPDPNGYQFWLTKLNEFSGDFEQAEMVKAFINSDEYRGRFAR